MTINDIFTSKTIIEKNYIISENSSNLENQGQTNDVFSDKWEKVNKIENTDKLYEFQYDWYLKLYGFQNEDELQAFLKTKKVIFDAGCGLGYKAAWFAKLAPKSIVIGMDYSDAAGIAAKNYEDIKNLFFIKGDIAKTGFKEDSIDYVSCDQVIMHTEYPEKTFAHLSKITKKAGEFACYVYAKKALPRELLDDYFRVATKNINQEELWEMSSQLTKLGKILSDLKIEIDAPDIPLLGIKGGKQDLQRFIYWNFIKCFWREEWGHKLCDATNYDWYSPSNAKRYSEKEFMQMISDNQLDILFFHKEEACYSGRFKK